MMKFIHKLTIVLALGGICGLAACSDDDQGFLKRNLREMSFPYVESSDTFTIRATGDWQISDAPDSREWTNAYGWVHVDQLSGKGDPGTYQKVTVTCDQNTSEERNATIYLHGCGEENVAIAIRQDNGIFEWKPFDNGQQFDVSGMLKLNAEAGAKLRIPYIKALGTEKYTVTVTQTGGEGITAASGSYSISAAGNGYIEVPLTGTATRQGIVTFAVKAMDEAGAEKDFGSVSTIVRAGFDAQGEELPLLTQNFGKFPWGGDCIGQKAGVTTADKTVANLSLDNETVSVSAGTNASIGGITSTVRNGNAAFYRAIGMEGWTGYLNYMCPGYIQLGLPHYGIAADDHHAAVVDVDPRLVEHPGLVRVLLGQRLQEALAAAVEHLLQQQGVIALEVLGQQGQPLADAGGDHRQGPDVVAGDLELVLRRLRLLPPLWWSEHIVQIVVAAGELGGEGQLLRARQAMDGAIALPAGAVCRRLAAVLQGAVPPGALHQLVETIGVAPGGGDPGFEQIALARLHPLVAVEAEHHGALPGAQLRPVLSPLAARLQLAGAALVDRQLQGLGAVVGEVDIGIGQRLQRKLAGQQQGGIAEGLVHHEVLLVEARWKLTVMADVGVISFTFLLQKNERTHMGRKNQGGGSATG